MVATCMQGVLVMGSVSAFLTGSQPAHCSGALQHVTFTHRTAHAMPAPDQTPVHMRSGSRKQVHMMAVRLGISHHTLHLGVFIAWVEGDL